MEEHSANGDDNDNDMNWNTDDEIDNFVSSPCSSSSVIPINLVETGIFDEAVARFTEMGFPLELIVRAIEETKGVSSDPEVIFETLVKFSEDEDINITLLSDDNNDDNLYADLFSSDEENEQNSHEDSRLHFLIKMEYSREEALVALERCGENASVGDVVDFICAAQMARQFDEFFEVPHEVKRTNSVKRQVYNEPPKRRKLNTSMAGDDELIRLPNPMIGFGLPNQPGLMSQRPVPIPDCVRGPPYFYYENVAMAPKGVWAAISRHLYNIIPEFVDSKHLCAAARKRGYIHNLPIKDRFQIHPLPHSTIQEAFPSMKRWWPSWDKRKKLNCLLTCIGSAQLTKKIRDELEKYDEEPPERVQIAVVNQCKKWNLVWVGKNKVAPLDPVEMENLLGFPKDHTRGGGITSTDRYKSLGNSFQVDTVAYHLSVLKPLFPKGINVLSLFTGIGGGEVALYRLKIPMKLVVSVEISEANQNVLRSFWEQTNQTGQLIEFRDVKKLDRNKIEQLMDQFGGFDLVIGGSPCNNLAGGNRHSRNGLEGEQSSLFYDYCRILNAVRDKAARMRR